MYIYVPQGQQSENDFRQNFLDCISILSFIIGLQNLDLNITANDIDNQTQAILDDLHTYLDKQERHLRDQDLHLSEQDVRLSRLERLMYEKDSMARKESSK